MNKDIAVCMIAKNCADIVGTTLRWACDNFEEINVVVDTENDDPTAHLIGTYGRDNSQIHIQHCKFDNFSAQKQRALDMATKPWVLLVDSDEIFEDSVPWDSIIITLDRGKYDGANFYRFNLQGDVNHFKLPVEYIRRLVRKEFAKMDGKPVDETIAMGMNRVINLEWGIIHFGHIRNADALLLKGRDRIKFINDDPCDGPGMRQHGDKWFLKRNDLWNRNVAEVPEGVKNTIRRYYNA